MNLPRLPFWIIRSTAVVLGILIAVAFGIRACIATFWVQCQNNTADIPSPDLRHIARRVTRICEGPLAVNLSITQSVDIAKAGDDRGVRVFESDEDDGEIRWSDDGQLVIVLSGFATILRSLHDVDGVHIAYHVKKKALDYNVAEDSERRTEELHRAGKLADSDYETEKKINQWLRQWREEFIRWAAENAIIDEPN